MSWKRNNNEIIKVFTFQNQTELARFFMDVAKLSDVMNHHPDASIFACNKIELKLSTHELGEVTDLDWELAEKIDLLDKKKRP